MLNERVMLSLKVVVVLVVSVLLWDRICICLRAVMAV